MKSVRLALLVVVALTANARAHALCPFCSEERGPTLVGDFQLASMVLVGTTANAKQGLDDSSTEFIIEEVLKPHEILAGRTRLTLPRYIPTKNKMLVFCDVYKGQIDPYRGVELSAKSQMPEYLRGFVKLKDKSQAERLRYAFDYLNAAELEIALDSYREFAKADYKDYGTGMAQKLPPEVLVGWLKDPKTPAFRYGLYASLLGHCGTPEHAKVLRDMITDPEKGKSSGIDGMMAGLVMLDKANGWAFLSKLGADPKEDFNTRYAVLRTIRFLWDTRPDLIPTGDMVAAVTKLTEHPDMSDFAIEDLRKWKQWQVTDRVLDLFTTKTHAIPVIKRSILRFALQAPTDRARQFVDAQRKRDIEWVRDAEELLKLEQSVSAAVKQ